MYSQLSLINPSQIQLRLGKLYFSKTPSEQGKKTNICIIYAKRHNSALLPVLCTSEPKLLKIGVTFLAYSNKPYDVFFITDWIFTIWKAQKSTNTEKWVTSTHSVLFISSLVLASKFLEQITQVVSKRWVEKGNIIFLSVGVLL